MIKRQSRAMLSEPDTEPIPVYRELADTRPIPVYRESLPPLHPSQLSVIMRPELAKPEPKPKAKPAAKPKGKPLSYRTIQVIMLIISLVIALLLYQIPFIGHY